MAETGENATLKNADEHLASHGHSLRVLRQSCLLFVCLFASERFQFSVLIFLQTSDEPGQILIFPRSICGWYSLHKIRNNNNLMSSEQTIMILRTLHCHCVWIDVRRLVWRARSHAIFPHSNDNVDKSRFHTLLWHFVILFFFFFFFVAIVHRRTRRWQQPFFHTCTIYFSSRPILSSAIESIQQNFNEIYIHCHSVSPVRYFDIVNWLSAVCRMAVPFSHRRRCRCRRRHREQPLSSAHLLHTSSHASSLALFRRNCI